MNIETIAENTPITLPKRKAGRPPKDASTELVLKPLPSIKEIKEDALQHLQAYYKEPWTEKNITYKLKAIQLILQQVDGLKDETIVAEQKEDAVTNTTKVPTPDFEEVELGSLSPEEFAAYQKAFGKKSHE